jgi:hypothetical protein
LDTTELESVEILLLLALYSVYDPNGMSPWVLTGILGRQAIALPEDISTDNLDRLSRPNMIVRASIAGAVKEADRRYWKQNVATGCFGAASR